MKHFSGNVVFGDLEFTGLNQPVIPIEIALVKKISSLHDRGMGLVPVDEYEEFQAYSSDWKLSDCSEWVKDNVVRPIYTNLIGGPQRDSIAMKNFMKSIGKPLSEIAYGIQHFIDPDHGAKFFEKPFLVFDVCPYDWMGIQTIFNGASFFGIDASVIPFQYMPIDFSTILFGLGIDPDISREKLAIEHGISLEGHYKHSALCDARLLAKLWEKLTP
jgi:hypothetical protein